MTTTSSLDRGHRGVTLQRALHYRAQTVLLTVIFRGQRLPSVEMQQQNANRFITAFYSNPVEGVDGIEVAGK